MTEKTEKTEKRYGGIFAFSDDQVMAQRRYQNLVAWQEAHSLCCWIYKIVRTFPSYERFGLTTQMQRSSASVPMNIAEGNSRRTRRHQIHFLEIALGSLEELHYQCFLSRDLGYVSEDQYQEVHGAIQRVGFLLNRLRSSLL